MGRPINNKMLLWIIVLLAAFLLAACSPNAPDLLETEGDEAPETVTSSSTADVTEETESLHSEITNETAEASETTTETTETTTEVTKETLEETTAEATRTTTETMSARPTVTPVPTAAPTPTPAPTPVARVVSLAIKCHIATEAGLAGAPADGIILEAVTVDLGEGESVFDVLIRVARAEGIAVASDGGSGANAFVKSIAGLTRVDAKSGWVYSVNGEFANIGSGAYKLSPGDSIEWHYTMDTGNDL